MLTRFKKKPSKKRSIFNILILRKLFNTMGINNNEFIYG